ncbi:MAG: hypothetical protein SynsKO_26360 [Synoicihabitans sp.]
MLRLFALFSLVVATAAGLSADPVSFSKSKTISFFREVSSRDLSGMAVRSDGRIIHGPTLSELAGNPVEDLWWDIEPWRDWSWLVGTGPNGVILKVEVDEASDTFVSEVWGETDASQIFVVKTVSDNRVISGGAPEGAIHLWKEDGELIRSAQLPGDSVLDILTNKTGDVVWVATGNPGEIYRLEIDNFASSDSDGSLEDRGITRFGSIRDRNVRRLAWGRNGVLLAGSSPSGNLYEFPEAGGSPLILMDQESGEVTDIHVSENGDIFAAVVTSDGTTTRRVSRTSTVGAPANDTEKSGSKTENTSPPSIMEAPPPVEKFSGRSSLVVMPNGVGLPESVSSRNSVAMYQIYPYRGKLLLAAGDDGELLGYDPVARRAISYAGSNAAQLTEMVEVPTTDQLLVMTNNPAGLSRLHFSDPGKRVAKTKRLSLQTPSEIGVLRFNRIRNLDPAEITVRMRANRGRDGREGWTPWVHAVHENGGWRAPDQLLGQYVEIELELPAEISETAELDQARLYYLPQNRRPVLQSFRLISPNFGLNPRGVTDSKTSNLNLGQVIGASPSPIKPEAERRRQALLSSPVLPQPGAQVAMWTVNDPDGDNHIATFSIRKDDSDEWVDLRVQSDENWVQFDRRSFAEGTYFTRLLVEETSPRRVNDRRTVEFQTDDLVIDLSPPRVTEVHITGSADSIKIQFSGSDQMSLISSAMLSFNNGYEVELGTPIDNIMDSPAEDFSIEIDREVLLNATGLEIHVGDKAGNYGSRRVALP